MDHNILSSTKKILGISPDDESFDQDILTFINSAFSDLFDLGVGPEGGFRIVDNTVGWNDFIDNTPETDRVKTFVHLKVRTLFDPPTTSYLISAMERQIQELTWRLSVNRESTAWVDPTPPVVIEDE